MNNQPIGVFDSGVGGLTVVREIFRNLPDEKIIYYGDTARVPYGNKSPETIQRYSRQIVKFLISEGVKAIVIACNTASALALSSVQEITDIPVIGVVEPGAKAAVKETGSGRIGIIGTSATIGSGIYDQYITELLPEAKVFGKACPLFVPLVEEGIIDDPVTVEMIHRYLDDMIHNERIDTLILGCTHYPVLRSVIAREIGGIYAGQEAGSETSDKEIGNVHGHRPANPGSDIVLVNPAYTTAMELKSLLEEKGLAADGKAAANENVISLQESVDANRQIRRIHRFIASDGPDSFRSFASRILEMDIPDVELKVLE